jgi:hypothetical protein
VIPPLAAFLRGYAWFAQANGLDRAYDEARVAEALAEAAELSAGQPANEPAALIFALTKRARALAGGWDFTVISAQNLARIVLRAEITIDDPIELDELRLRVVAKLASFDDVRAWVAAHIHPLTSGRD